MITSAINPPRNPPNQANPKRLKLNGVQQMIEDRTGAIWFASWTNEGACRLDGRTLINVTAARNAWSIITEIEAWGVAGPTLPPMP